MRTIARMSLVQWLKYFKITITLHHPPPTSISSPSIILHHLSSSSTLDQRSHNSCSCWSGGRGRCRGRRRGAVIEPLDPNDNSNDSNNDEHEEDHQTFVCQCCLPHVCQQLAGFFQVFLQSSDLEETLRTNTEESARGKRERKKGQRGAEKRS